MLPTDHAYQKSDYSTASLKTWVNTVVGEMIAIDRRQKFVKIRNQQTRQAFEVPYDHLILATGIQFQVSSRDYLLSHFLRYSLFKYHYFIIKLLNIIFNLIT